MFFVWEAMRPLLRGAATVVVPGEVVYDSAALLAFLTATGATEMLFTPTLLSNVLNTIEPAAVLEGFKGLRTILLNGEVVSTALAKRLLKLFPEKKVRTTPPPHSTSSCGLWGHP